MVAEDLSLHRLDPGFRRMLEDSATLIIAAGPNRSERIRRLARLTVEAAYREPDPRKAEIAFALAAEFRRRAAGWPAASGPAGRDQRQPVLVEQKLQVAEAGRR